MYTQLQLFITSAKWTLAVVETFESTGQLIKYLHLDALAAQPMLHAVHELAIAG